MKVDNYEKLAERVDLLQSRILAQEDMRARMYHQMEVEQLQTKMACIVQGKISKEISK